MARSYQKFSVGGGQPQFVPFQTWPDGQDEVMLAERLTEPPGPVATAVHVIVPFQFAVATLEPPEAGLSVPEPPLLQEKVTEVASVVDHDPVYCWPKMTLDGVYAKLRVGANATQLDPFQAVPLAQPHTPDPLRTWLAGQMVRHCPFQSS